ncbi:hypothetical protein BC936DRAFT_138187 [Jimgerdemannia flammicorona]|uniref:Uncharacterized protein n=1 Tax=Jimgerdemannia flammicorona TaxID=994334 RepID=A0A433DIQ7_9FUNG|nr:hypothetical protein BC936DRAFT_138187 [Jimgerdemannia flammicorona]
MPPSSPSLIPLAIGPPGRVSYRSMSYRIQCKQGIVGGIVAPTVKQLVEIEGDKTGATVRFSTRKARRDQEVQTLVSDLRSELHNLPTEQPVGAQDIYGFDISISFDWNDFHWQNGKYLRLLSTALALDMMAMWPNEFNPYSLHLNT